LHDFLVFHGVNPWKLDGHACFAELVVYHIFQVIRTAVLKEQEFLGDKISVLGDGVKGTAFLTYDYDNDYYDPDRDDDQWLYLPALKKSKRIASTDKSKSFMGSDFTYSDMTSRDLEDYDFKLLKTQTVKDKETWIIEALPKNNEVIEETGYTKSLLFVRQDNYVVVRAVHFVKEGSKLKYMDVKKLELIDNIWIPTETHMTTKKRKMTLHKTILKHHDIRFNQDLDESFFTVRRMEKGL